MDFSTNSKVHDHIMKKTLVEFVLLRTDTTLLVALFPLSQQITRKVSKVGFYLQRDRSTLLELCGAHGQCQQCKGVAGAHRQLL